ncbi:MAG: efflux RND transporter periplasmic adaptor subunit, partial [Romboutsia sp.]|nr:efflux RND transporter periplasmic adaptor subunit [Romboutsia sp.]
MNIVIKESNNALLVPIQAVKSKGGKYTVSVKSGDETKDVEVEVGLQNSSSVEILSGLKQGDIVVYTQATQSNKSSQGNFSKGEMPNGMPGFGGGEMPNFGGERPSGMPSGMPSGGQGGSRPSKQ